MFQKYWVIRTNVQCFGKEYLLSVTRPLWQSALAFETLPVP